MVVNLKSSEFTILKMCNKESNTNLQTNGYLTHTIETSMIIITSTNFS